MIIIMITGHVVIDHSQRRSQSAQCRIFHSIFYTGCYDCAHKNVLGAAPFNFLSMPLITIHIIKTRFMFVCLFVCLLVCLFVCLFVCLSGLY